MLQIQNTIVSLDLIRQCFCCDAARCKGACCEEGDSGAPLNEDEKQQMENDLSGIIPYMDPASADIIKTEGISYKDKDGELVTQLKNNRECVFAVKKDGIWQCAVELAHNDGKSSLRKPLSCWLYPVRVSKHPTFIAVEYHRWDICRTAVASGRKTGIPLYVYLKQPLIARFGKEWYDELDFTAKEFLKLYGR